MSKRMLGAMTACLFLFTAPVYAEEDEYARGGVYFMATASYAVEMFDLDKRPSDFENSFGAGARLGYRLLPFLAAEAQYEWIGGFDEQALLPEGGKIKAGEIIAHAVTLNAKVYPLGGRVQPYALVGVGVGRFEIKERLREPLDDEGFVTTEVTTQDEGVLSRYGLGVDLYGDETWGMFAEAAYVLPLSGLSGLDYISVQWGLLWRF